MDKKSFMFDELMNTDIENTTELQFTYRRGYMDGFFTAFDNFYDLLIAGVSNKNAYNRCWDFWNQELRKWRNGDCSHEVLPPQLPDLSLEDK